MGLFTTPSCGRAGPGCREIRTLKGGGAAPGSSRRRPPISSLSMDGRSRGFPWARSRHGTRLSLGPRRGGAPSGMARAHGPPPSRVVRGKKSLARETQHSPPRGQAATTPQPPAPRMGVVDDRTTEARARRAQQSGAGRELTPWRCGRLTGPTRGHRFSPRAAIVSRSEELSQGARGSWDADSGAPRRPGCLNPTRSR